MGETKFRTIEKTRRVSVYPVTENELDTLGSLNILEQIFLSALSLFAGSTLSFVGTWYSGINTLFIAAAFWASLALFTVMLICFIATHKSRKKYKDSILNN